MPPAVTSPLGGGSDHWCVAADGTPARNAGRGGCGVSDGEKGRPPREGSVPRALGAPVVVVMLAMVVLVGGCTSSRHSSTGRPGTAALEGVLHASNRCFKQAADRAGVEFGWHSYAYGTHAWMYGDRSLTDYLPRLMAFFAKAR